MHNEWILKLNGFTVKSYSWPEVVQLIAEAASHRAMGMQNFKFNEEYDKLMAQVLTDNDDNCNIEERNQATQGS